MAKLYKVLVNDGNGAETKPINVTQGVGDKGTPVRIVAQRGVRYELQDTTKTKNTAPDQVRVKRVGKNLTLMFDGSQKPDVVVEDFYAVGSASDGTLPTLAGLAENGSVYEYIPQDPALSSVTPALKDGNTPVLMSLGGGALGDGFVLSALPIAAAAGGVGGWAIAGGALGAAALAGGGGGGGGAADTTPPGAATVVVPDAADGSVNATEAQDGTAVNVTLPADALVGDTVSTLYTRPDGTKQTLTHVLTAADIAAKSITQIIPVADLKDDNGNYMDGTWTVITTVTDAAKNVSTPVQSTFVLDTLAPVAENISGNLKHDGANDTGAALDDNITSNSTPVLVVKAETGATVDVVVNGKTYRATESTTTAGEYEVLVGTKEAEKKLADNAYTPSIKVTDAAGNVTTKNGVAFTVDTSSDTNPANGTSTDKNPSDLNSGDTTAIAITAVSEDTGSSATDFITSDRSVLISGTVANFYSTAGSVGDVVHVQIFDTAGNRVAHEFVTPNNGTWSMATPTLKDGDYTLKADIVDAAGNTVKSALPQALKISPNYLSAVKDEAQAQEAGVDAEKKEIATVNPTGNVLSNDIDVSAVGRVVIGAKIGGADALTEVATGTSKVNGLHLQGKYGELVIGADGTYQYIVDDVKANRLAAKDDSKETFTYVVRSSNDSTSSATLTVTVKGANDLAVFDSDSSFGGTVALYGETVRGTVAVSDVDTNQTGFSNPTQLNGQYGSFRFSSIGGSATWIYTVDKATFVALFGGQEATDTLNITSLDGSATKSVVVKVHGVNDAPILTSDLSLAVTSENRNTAQPDTKSLKGATKVLDLVGHITDVDSQSLKGIAVTGVGNQGTLWYSLDQGENWQYAQNTSTGHALLLAAVDKTYVYFQQTLGTTWEDSSVTKSFTFAAWDQTSSTNGIVDKAGSYVDASFAGLSTAFSTVQQDVLINDIFNIADTTSTLSVKGGTGFDTLVLNGSGLTLDLSNATFTQPLSGIEKIDIKGTGENIIKLNLDSVTQADVIGSVHTLFITGDNGDAVNLVKPEGWAVATSLPTQTVNNIAYNVYHLDATHDLLIQQAITNVTFT